MWVDHPDLAAWGAALVSQWLRYQQSMVCSGAAGSAPSIFSVFHWVLCAELSHLR